MVIETIGIIGNGKMAVDIVKFITLNSNVKIQFVLFEPVKNTPYNYLANLCDKQSIKAFPFEKINNPETVAIIRENQPDLIFNINSFQIIKEPILSIPRDGIINFHNGPLPRYGGVNIPSWAILNGEQSHGVTWHFMDNGIDSGRIVLQKMFPLPDTFTASELMRKCIVEGINIFQENFNSLVKGQLSYTEQTNGKTYFSRKDKPLNDGFINLSLEYKEIDKLVRALNFFPFENTFCDAKLKICDGIIYPLRIIPIERETPQLPGTIVSSTEHEFIISCVDKNILIHDFTDETGERNNFKQLAEKYPMGINATR